MMGYFRDDIPLCEFILDDAGEAGDRRAVEGARFHRRLAPLRQHTGYIWYERAESATIRRWGPEFDEFRSEDKDITSEAKLEKFAEMYLAKGARKLRGTMAAMRWRWTCWMSFSKA